MKKTWRTPLGLLLSAAPAAVQAQDDLDYTTNAGGSSVTITDYTGSPWVVAIPTNSSGLIVTSIGVYAFADAANLNLSTINPQLL